MSKEGSLCPGFQRLPGHMTTDCCCFVALACLTLCHPVDCSTPGFPALHCLLQFMSIQSVMPSDRLILCHPLLLLPSVFPSTRVFSNESAPCIRQTKYLSFSFSPSCYEPVSWFRAPEM